MPKDKFLKAFKRGKEKGIDEQQFYNQFGFRINPFDKRNPITSDDKSFFYEDIGQLEPFMETLGSHFSMHDESRDPFSIGSHLLLVGSTGQGKSAIFKYVYDLLGEEYNIARVDLEELCFDRAGSIPRPRQWTEILSQLPLLESKVIESDLVFLDGVGALAMYLEQFIHQFWTSSSNMPLIVAAISKKELIYLKNVFLTGIEGSENLSFFFNFFHSLQFSLRPYTTEEINNIIDKRISQAQESLSPFTPNIISRIARLSHGLPGLACRIGESLLRISVATKNENLLGLLDHGTSFTEYREALKYYDEISVLVSSINLRYKVFRELLVEAGRFKVDRGIDVTDPVFVTNTSLFEQYAMQNTTLATTMGVGNSTVSYHLGSLTKSGILHVHKRGKNRFYQLKEPFLSLFESLVSI
ncbi:MAG: ArsR/SmtB family transcription factor [Candidatus Hodarchaeales archaeon]|jgi:Cdc6-like AAA superfamily ATPase